MGYRSSSCVVTVADNSFDRTGTRSTLPNLRSLDLHQEFRLPDCRLMNLPHNDGGK